MYEKWKKKRKREIDDNDVENDEDYRKRPKVKVNQHLKDEIRNVQQIRKIFKERESSKRKNMEKTKRRKIEDKNRFLRRGKNQEELFRNRQR